MIIDGGFALVLVCAFFFVCVCFIGCVSVFVFWTAEESNNKNFENLVGNN